MKSALVALAVFALEARAPQLGTPEPAPSDESLGELYDRFLEELRAWRLAEAESLALAMHERAGESWSALSLALLSTRLGLYERADRVLAEQLERATETAERLELCERRAIAALGAGNEHAARALLGRGLAAGGVDSAQILARLALAEGDRGRARRLFGSLVPGPPAQLATETVDRAPWALRGWGLAMLPAADQP